MRPRDVETCVDQATEALTSYQATDGRDLSGLVGRVWYSPALKRVARSEKRSARSTAGTAGTNAGARKLLSLAVAIFLVGRDYGAE